LNEALTGWAFRLMLRGKRWADLCQESGLDERWNKSSDKLRLFGGQPRVHSFLLGDKPGENGQAKAGLKVLVVDSDPENVHELGRALRNQGYEPLEATAFEAAKALWMAEKPSMLIADIRLGQYNGLQLLLRAKAELPDVAAVITCGFPDKVLEAETQRLGGTFLVKPLRAEDVLTALLGPRQPARIERLEEHRAGDRRGAVVPQVFPDRRLSERRGRA
jgi:ActR/RegA family two-component response regulator